MAASAIRQGLDPTRGSCEVRRTSEAPFGREKMQAKTRRFPPGVEPRHVIELHDFLPYRVHLLSAKIARPADVRLASGKVVRARDWRVILQLASRGPLTNRELATMVGLDAANITRVVQYLNEIGLVTTRASKTDRRKQIISLTAEGAAAHDEIAPQRKRAGEQLLECFTAAEQKQLFTLLDRLEEHIGNDNDESNWE